MDNNPNNLGNIPNPNTLDVNNDVPVNSSATPVQNANIVPETMPTQNTNLVQETVPVQSTNVVPESIPISSVTNTSGEVAHNAESTEKKKGSSKIIIIILVLLLLGAVGYFAYTKLLATPEKIYTEFIKESFGNLTKTTEDFEDNFIKYDLSKDSILNEGAISFNSNIEGLEFLNSSVIKTSVGISPSTKELLLSLSYEEDNESYFDAAAYYLEDTFYLDLKDAYKDVLSMLSPGLFDELDFEENVTASDINTLISKLEGYTINAINEDDIETKDEIITINGKDKDVTSHIYDLDSDKLAEVIKSILSDAKSDEEFVTLLAKVTGDEKTTIIEMLEYDYSDLIKEDNLSLEMEIYTSGFTNSFVGYSIKLDGSLSLEATYYEETNILDGTITITDDYSAETSIDFKVINNNDKTSYVLSYEDALYGNFKITIDTENKLISDTEMTNNFSFNIEMTTSGETQTIGVSYHSTTKVNEDFAIDISDSTDFEDLDDDELDEIIENILENLEDSTFNSIIPSSIEHTETASVDSYLYTTKTIIEATR